MRCFLPFGLVMVNTPLRQAFQSTVLQSSSRLFSATASTTLRVDDPGLDAVQNFAGLVASFDSSTGALIPLPDYYIPPALKEWEQVPTALEVLTSSMRNRPSDRLQTLVLPETGCSIDNLETIMTKEIIKTLVFQGDGISDPIAALVKSSRAPTFEYVEAIFRHEIVEDENRSKYRCRVAVPIEAHSKPIKVVVERFVKEVEGNKMVADTIGGGLDGQSVTRWLGSQLSSATWKAFAENKCSFPASKCLLNLPLGIIVERQGQRLIISKTGQAESSISLDLLTLTLQGVSSVTQTLCNSSSPSSGTTRPN